MRESGQKIVMVACSIRFKIVCIQKELNGHAYRHTDGRQTSMNIKVVNSKPSMGMTDSVFYAEIHIMLPSFMRYTGAM
jgi:hypothetical protein